VVYILHKILTFGGQTKEDEIFGICSMNSEEGKCIRNFDKNIKEIEKAWGAQRQIVCSKMTSQDIRCD
jgi:hypothetical protein